MSLRQQQQTEEAERSKRRRELMQKMAHEKKEKEKTRAIERKRELLKRVNDLKRRNPNIASQPRANINPKNLLPKPEIKCYIVSREIIERVRKTTDLVGSIFGSPEYVRDIFYFFLQKYGYMDLPLSIKSYFRALMQHYFENDVMLYPEDEIIRNYLGKIIMMEDDHWQRNLHLLYRQYKIAIRTVKADQRRWFPEEILIIASIFKHYLRFGDDEFVPVKFDTTRLSSIYVRDNPLRTKYLQVLKYLHTHTPIRSVIQLNI